MFGSPSETLYLTFIMYALISIYTLQPEAGEVGEDKLAAWTTWQEGIVSET